MTAAPQPDPLPPAGDPRDPAPSGDARDGVPVTSGPSEPAPAEQVRWVRVALTCLGILALGLVAAVALRLSRQEAPRRITPPARAGVRVVEVGPRELLPEVVGLGRARPARRVTISAQVGGTAVEVAPELEDGNVIPAGTLVVRIDPSDHQAEVDRVQAQLAGARAEATRVERQGSFLGQRAAVARQLIEVERRELARLEGLFAKGVIRDRELDVARLNVLRNEDALVTLEQTLAVLGPQSDAARARVREVEAQLATALLRLERTAVRLPFSGQVVQVAVEAHQQVSAGQALFELWQVDPVEVPVVLPLAEASLLEPDLQIGGDQPPVTARVEMEGTGAPAQWTGVLRRFEPIDAETQTVRAVVEVAVQPGERRLPPNAFCRVTFAAPAIQAPLAIPLTALQERDRAYVARDGRLVVASLQLGRRVGRYAMVEGGLAPGDLVIVSPLDRAVEGALLAVTRADASLGKGSALNVRDRPPAGGSRELGADQGASGGADGTRPAAPSAGAGTPPVPSRPKAAPAAKAGDAAPAEDPRG